MHTPSQMISNTFGLMPLITLYDLLLVVNSNSTRQFFLLILFNSCGLLILRKGLPKRQKVNASNRVDFPAPLSPSMRVLGDSSRDSSLKLSPVPRKFFHLITLKTKMALTSLFHKFVSQSVSLHEKSIITFRTFVSKM